MYSYHAKVDRIVDGDTIDLVIVETEKDFGKYGRYIGFIRMKDSLISLNDELG